MGAEAAPVPEETSVVKEESKEKEVKSASPARGRGKKSSSKGQETGVKGTPVTEDAPIMDENQQQKGGQAAPTARVSGRRRGNRGTETDVKGTPLTEDASLVKENQQQKGLERGNGKKRGQRVSETAITVNMSAEAKKEVDNEISGEDVDEHHQSKTMPKKEEMADMVAKTISDVIELSDSTEEPLAAKIAAKKRKAEVKSTTSKTFYTRNTQGLETKEELVNQEDISEDHGSPQKRRRGPGAKKEVSNKRTQDNNPSSTMVKRSKRGQASSYKPWSSERSMDSWVDDVTSDVMSEREPVANSKKEQAANLKKESVANLKKEQVANSKKESVANLKNEPDANLKKQQASKLSEKSLNAKFVGAHCSIAGSLVNAVRDAVSIKATSFALFLRSQRQWHSKPLEEEDAERFREACAEHGFPPHLILPHGSYLLNCGSPNEETLSKSRAMLEDEIRRCEKLGLKLYNFHPGSTCGQMSVEECLDRIAESVNMALAKTSGVTAVLENMSCQGNTIGGRFEELRGIIDRVKDKSRVGVCLDTCHAFAAGYDLSTEAGFQQMTSDFDRVVGFQYLRGMHVNDSKGEVGCHLDRHENIGKGKIGLEGFRRIMNDPRFNNIPLILETPPDFGYAREIKTLNSLMNR